MTVFLSPGGLETRNFFEPLFFPFTAHWFTDPTRELKAAIGRGFCAECASAVLERIQVSLVFSVDRMGMSFDDRFSFNGSNFFSFSFGPSFFTKSPKIADSTE